MSTTTPPGCAGAWLTRWPRAKRERLSPADCELVEILRGGNAGDVFHGGALPGRVWFIKCFGAGAASARLGGKGREEAARGNVARIANNPNRAGIRGAGGLFYWDGTSCMERNELQSVSQVIANGFGVRIGRV